MKTVCVLWEVGTPFEYMVYMNFTLYYMKTIVTDIIPVIEASFSDLIYI
jgi:hypothetical protein